MASNAIARNQIIVFPYKLPEVWYPFLGDTRQMLEKSKIRRGGSVYLSKILGKPLSEELWQDLYERLGIISCNVYGPGFDEQKTIGVMWGPHVWIRLDENYLVREIELDNF